MANHVYFNINIEGLTEEQYACLFKTEEITRTREDGSKWSTHELLEVHEQPFMSNVERTYDKEGWLENSYQWYCDNCGAKWVNIEDWEGGMITGYSAWSMPTPMVENMLTYASAKFNTVLNATMTYEDEYRNFIGRDEFETYAMDGEWGCSTWEGYIDGNELTKMVEEKFDCDCDDNDFQWFEEYKDTGICPQEWLDEVVDNFWKTGELNDSI